MGRNGVAGTLPTALLLGGQLRTLRPCIHTPSTICLSSPLLTWHVQFDSREGGAHPHTTIARPAITSVPNVPPSPPNPLVLGRFIAEKVVHHPTIIAAHAEGRGWSLDGDADVKSKFWGRSIELHPEGGCWLLVWVSVGVGH